jgi:hypothetical protein
MSAPPMQFKWDGEVFRPKHPKLADKHFVIGETYVLEKRHDRSHASHSHFFAAVHEAWANLPEDVAERFPTEDHLRKYALVKAGFRDEHSIACSSKAEAQRVAAFVRPIDDYAVVVVNGAQVLCYTAKSQSYRAMGRAEFQRSKDAVLEILAAMIGNTKKALEQNAGKAA